MEKIRKFFEKTIKINDQDWAFFFSKLRHREFPKKHLLLMEGQVENSLSATAWLLIVFFLIVLPANIYSAIKQVNYQKATFDGNGLSYLWFRVPQRFFSLSGPI